MEILIFNTKEKKVIFRNIIFTYESGALYEELDSESLLIILSEQYIKFYWRETEIDGNVFNSLDEFKTYLDNL